MIPIELQVIGASLRAIAEEMGAALIRSAFSANIKERRDCSTALFDERGRMVTQAEHIPVHLGAMPEAVAAVTAHDPAPGEPWILNDPYAGGTHLPDLTIVTRTSLGYAVTRAHHADVGGSEPGSLPPGSRTLDEEGVVIPPTRLDEDTLAALVRRMRNPDERRGDLRAQLAAHHLAEQRIDDLCARRGREPVEAAMDELLAYSERVVRAAIRDLPDGRFEGADVLETPRGSLEIRATITVSGEEIDIDFEGTAPQHEGNLNCPLSVTRSACFYVVRCLTAPDLPASGGAFVPVTVRAPAGCLVNARPPAAVAAGNVETSSRITDAVFAAFGQAMPVPAQGQGTMNNVVFGNDRFTYYETIGGGQGACPGADGPSAVHVAMSNTLNTPAEALELSYPLRVERYELRRGSGGDGLHRGGDGVVREIRVLEHCRLSLLAQRRSTAPRGVEGGDHGAPGRSFLNGVELPGFASLDLAPGDVLRIETPGGGGWGRLIAMTDEAPLSGGRVTPGVVRVGDTVRRPVGPNAGFAHALLDHLEAVGFDAAPRFVGVDDQGREMLTFIGGDVPTSCESIVWTDEQVAATATLLRRFHAATARSPLRGSHEVVCHGDFGPWNLVWRDALPMAVIDFDSAAPGAAIDDLGYTAWKLLNLGLVELPASEQRRRLDVLASSYGAHADDALLSAIAAAQARMQELLERAADAGRQQALSRLEQERRWLAENGASLLRQSR